MTEDDRTILRLALARRVLRERRADLDAVVERARHDEAAAAELSAAMDAVQAATREVRAYGQAAEMSR